MIITFRVIGEPVGQPRPRARVMFIGKRPTPQIYNPDTADGWKKLIAVHAAPHRPRTPLDGPVCVDVDLIFPRPQRLLTRNSPDGEVPHTAKPDVDNAIKPILDVLTQIGVFNDDAQVCDGRIRKFYASRRGTPGARVTIQTIDEVEV